MKNGLLLGAGFSYDFGMPLAREVAEILFARFDDATASLVSEVLSKQQPFTKDRPIDPDAVKAGVALVADYKKRKCFDYESLIAEVESRAHSLGRPQSELDAYHFVYSYLYSLVKEILDLYQLYSYNDLYEINKRWFKDFDVLLGDGRTWAFTLNHDLYLEFLSIDLGHNITHGDREDISFPVNNMDLSKTLRFTCTARAGLNISGLDVVGESGINILKLHGGLTELLYRDEELICNLPLNRLASRELFDDFQTFTQLAYIDGGMKVPDSRDRVITNNRGDLDIATEAMLTGHRKYTATTNVKPGEEKLSIFDGALSQTDHLIVVGYSFGDMHVNVRISNAMVRNEAMRVTIIDPGLRTTPECLEQFDYGGRVRRAMSGIAQWLTYIKGDRWDPEQQAGLTENSRLRTEIRAKVEASLTRPPFPGARTRPIL